MVFWTNIINTAMIGTDKKQVGATELLPGLEAITNLIQADDTIDKTEQFMRIATVAFNFRKCGALPLYKEGVTINTALPEEKMYCSDNAFLVLKKILDSESIPLLLFWLQHCQANNTIVLPEIIPTIFDIANKQKTLQTLAAACCGKRGGWLATFNNEWKFSTAGTDEELWKTGTSEQRKEILTQLRKTNKTQARQWLQESWPQEDANSKTDFLKILSPTIDADDIVFLESLSTEKSKKVKDETILLLKKIPTSKIVSQYWEVTKEAVQLTVEKGLFGINKKKKLTIELPKEFNQDIFKTGIEKLSNNKAFTDDEFIVYQLMQHVPLQNWEHHFNETPEETIKLFQQNEATNKLIPAFILSAVYFNDLRWAIFLMQFVKTFYLDLIPLLPIQQQEYYSNKFFVGNENNIINSAIKRTSEWGLELTKNILSHTAKNPYNYYKNFYNEHIQLIPTTIETQLNKCAPQEQLLQNQWNNTRDYIMKLVQLKKESIISNSK